MKTRIQIDIQDDTDPEVAVKAVGQIMATGISTEQRTRIYSDQIEVEHPRSNICGTVHFDYIVDWDVRIFRVWMHE